MPATRRPYKSHGKSTAKSSPYRRTNRAKYRAKGVLRGRKPRFALRQTPFGRSNSYPFTRSLTEYTDAWSASADDRFTLSTDSKYYIMQMGLRFNELPSYDEFRTLFTRYKITSWKTTITPSFKDNVGMFRSLNSDNTNDQLQPAIPNLEMFVIPASYTVKPATRAWGSLDFDQITDILNQTQLKARRVVPSKGFSFSTPKPVIAKTGFIPAKQDGPALDTEVYMGKAPWLTNGAGPHHTGPALDDQRTVEHYGFTVLIRRVDGLSMSNFEPNPGTSTVPARMGWRVTRQAYFKMDKVR